jgi:chaperonin GroES
MFKPILDRVLLRPVENEAAPKSGIIIPEKYRQDSQTGEVVAIGDFVVLGGERIPLETFIKPGDIVRFSEYAVEKFPEDGEELILLRIQDIRGKATEKARAARG